MRKTGLGTTLFLFLIFLIPNVSAVCITPFAGIQINQSETFCTGSYDLSTTGNAIVMNGNNLTLDCNSSEIYGSYGGNGIRSDTKSNITVRNCIIKKFNHGVVEVDNNNLTLDNLTLTDLDGHGLYLDGGTGINFLNSNISYSGSLTIGDIIQLYDTVTDLLIENSVVHDCYERCISTDGTTGNKNFTIKSSTFYNSKIENIFLDYVDGIYLENVTVQSVPNNNFRSWYGSNILIKNSVFYDGARGINIRNAENITIDNVTVYNQSILGIIIRDTNNIIIMKNKVSNIANKGIWVFKSNNSVVTKSKVSNMSGSGWGIINDAVNNSIINESEVYNTSLRGIYIKISNNVILKDNTVNLCPNGFASYDTRNMMIDNLSIYDSRTGFITFRDIYNSTFSNIRVNNSSEYGILINSAGTFENKNNISIEYAEILNSAIDGIKINASDNVTVKNSKISNSSVYGINIDSSTNVFVYNNEVYLSGTANANGTANWNTTYTCVGTNIIGGDCSGGNFWDDYIGYDVDGDGIGEQIYPISSADYLPLTNIVFSTAVFLISPDYDYRTSDITPDFTFKFLDNVPNMSCELLINSTGYGLNDTVFNNTVTTITANHSITPDGTYQWLINCTDPFGGYNQSEARNIIIDTTPPIITIHSPKNTTYSTTSISLEVSANEPIDTWWYNLNNAGNVTFIPNTTITAQEGSNYLIVFANDTLEYLNSSDVYFTVTLIPPIEAGFLISTPTLLGMIMGAGAILTFLSLAVGGVIRDFRALIYAFLFLVIAVTLAVTMAGISI